RTDGGAPFDYAMRAYCGAGADGHVGAYHGVRPHRHGRINAGTRLNNGCGMNIAHGPTGLNRWGRQPTLRMVHMSSASQATSSPTLATPLNFQMPPRTRSMVMDRISWSPGSTGRLKRAPSMPTK